MVWWWGRHLKTSGSGPRHRLDGSCLVIHCSGDGGVLICYSAPHHHPRLSSTTGTSSSHSVPGGRKTVTPLHVLDLDMDHPAVMLWCYTWHSSSYYFFSWHQHEEVMLMYLCVGALVISVCSVECGCCVVVEGGSVFSINTLLLSAVNCGKWWISWQLLIKCYRGPT